MLINMSDIQLFQILREKIGEQEAEALVSFVDGKIQDNNKINLNILATKDDIAGVRMEIANLLKWMVGMFIPLYLTIIGLMITILLKH